MRTEDKKVKDIIVYCPYQKREINVAPILATIHYYYGDFASAADKIADHTENLGIYATSMMEQAPIEFSSLICTLRDVRRVLDFIHRNPDIDFEL
jgi:hypothetical protein